MAALAGSAELLPAVADMIRVTQDTIEAVAHGVAGARILEAIILGASPSEAVHATVAALQVRRGGGLLCRASDPH